MPRSDRTVRTIGGLALAVAACLLLVPAGLLLVVVGIVASAPDSDTGDRESTTSILALLLIGATVLMACLPAVYLFARDRFVAGIFVTAAGISAALVTLFAA